MASYQSFSVKIDSESIAILKAFPSALQKAIRSKMKSAAEFLQEGARLRAPIKTGHLRYGNRRTGYGAGGIWGVVLTEAIKLEARATYAAIVEERKPYITPTSYELEKVAKMINIAMTESWGK